MSSNLNNPSVAPYGIARREQLLAAFKGSVEPIAVGPGYKFALFCAAFTLLLLPLFYLALIAAVSYATYWHAVENTSIFQNVHAKIALVLYAAPLLAGVVLVFFMIKPLLARRGQAPCNRTLSREDQPLLHDFVARICAAVGAPAPSRIEADCRVNASAHLRRGWRSLFGKNDLVLTIGLPLVDGLTLEQLAGVFAHEFGHFAQGAGMRLSYVVRSVNGWFSRVVYERDQWDQQLDDAGKSDAWWGISVAVGLARGAVWVSRKLLMGLMFAGHAISSYLMRQMEFDADRYEARLVGAEVFAQTCHELSYLNAAFQSSLRDVGLAWRDGQLADSLPRLVASHRRQLDGALLTEIAAGIGASKTTWRDSHPADSERLASARRETAPPVFRSALPAEVLFRDFANLSREISRSFYRDQLELSLDGATLQPVEDLVARQQDVRTGLAAVARLLRRQFDGFLPPTLPAASPEIRAQAAGDPAAALAALRSEQLADDARLAKAAEHFDRFTNQLYRLGGGEALVQQGVKLAKGAFGLTDTSPDGIASRQRELERRRAQLRPALERGHELAGRRAALALAVLEQRDWAPPEEALEAGRLRPVVAALAGQSERLDRLRRAMNVAAVLGDVLQNGLESPARTVAHLRLIAAGIARDLGELRRELEPLPYPFRQAREGLDLGAFLVPEVPAESDVGGAFDAGNRAFREAGLAGARVWGRIALMVEKVEQELGLPPLAAQEGGDAGVDEEPAAA